MIFLYFRLILGDHSDTVTSFESVVQEEGGLGFLQGLGHSLLDALVSGGRIFADFAGGEAIVNK